MELLAIVNGTVLPAAEASIPIQDPGVLRGDAVFEAVRLYAGRPYALDAHLARMEHSAANLRLALDVELVRRDIETLVAAAGPLEAAVRYVATQSGYRLGLIEELGELPATLALKTVRFAPTRVLDGVKSVSYAANMLTRRLAKEQGADDALLCTPHGRVLEAPTSSFFAILGGELVTPPLSDHILDSITRRLVLAETDAVERVLTLDDLGSLEEAFLASTMREVHPVHAIDAHTLPATPGPGTRAVAQAVRARIERDLAVAA